MSNLKLTRGALISLSMSRQADLGTNYFHMRWSHPSRETNHFSCDYIELPCSFLFVNFCSFIIIIIIIIIRNSNKMLYLQFYILLRALVDSADAVLNCVELFSLMLVLLLYERAPALFESHSITFIVLSFFLSFLFTFHRCFFGYNSVLC